MTTMTNSYCVAISRPTDHHHSVDIDIAGLGHRLYKVRNDRYPPLGSTKLDALAGVGRGTVSRIESADRPEVSAVVLAKIASVLGVRVDWLIFGNSVQKTAAPVDVDTPIGGFISKVMRLPGLIEWIEGEGAMTAVGIIARGLHLYERRKPELVGGVPKGGWGRYFGGIAQGGDGSLGADLPPDSVIKTHVRSRGRR